MKEAIDRDFEIEDGILTKYTEEPDGVMNIGNSVSDAQRQGRNLPSF